MSNNKPYLYWATILALEQIAIKSFGGETDMI